MKNRISWKFSRRSFLTVLGGLFAAVYWPRRAFTASRSFEPPNVLLITADDLDYASLGVTGCSIQEITPHLDKLASEGLRFERSHVTISVCQPSRQSMMTGLYPHNFGSAGFGPVNESVTTLTELLRQRGYLNGIFAKVDGLEPQEKFAWDVKVAAFSLGRGRSPQRFYEQAGDFFARAKSEGRPFFLMANSVDPHRPFAGTEGEAKYERSKQIDIPDPRRRIRADEVDVPPFLPDLPDVREDLADYFSSVNRCDESVGKVLEALAESGQSENTIVLFLSDNGMAFPFAKGTVYPTGTRTPLIVRWPKHIQPSIDVDHFVAGVDIMPTILELLGIGVPRDLDGRSFAPILRGRNQPGRERVFTFFYETAKERDYPMRAVQDRDHAYVFNEWVDGKRGFRPNLAGSPTYRAMNTSRDPAIRERLKAYRYRAREELYDLNADPHTQSNVIEDLSYAQVCAGLKDALEAEMVRSRDPLLESFRATR